MTEPVGVRGAHSTEPATAGGAKLLLLAIDRVRPDPRTPRRVFDEDALDQLAESIKCWGQLQPIVVRRVEDAYQLICGERRLRAHQRVGLETIWAIERDATDQGALALSLVENLHRVDLSHAEKVAGLDQLAELAHALGLRKTAHQLRMDPGWLSRQLSVHRDPIIFPALEAGRLGFGQAAELCRAPQTRRQELIERIDAAHGPVSIAMLRTWVEETRGEVPRRRRQVGNPKPPPTSAADDEREAYTSLLQQVEALSAPRSPAGRAVLDQVVQRIQQLLVQSTVVTSASRLAVRKRSVVELACLMCGERAGTMVDDHVVGTRRGSIAIRGRRLYCGRCGGSLVSDNRTERYAYNGAGVPVASA